MIRRCTDCGGMLRRAFGRYLSCSRCGHVFPKDGE